MQKWNGNNQRNNGIVVDYENRTVRFDPSADLTSIGRYLFIDLFNTASIASFYFGGLLLLLSTFSPESYWPTLIICYVVIIFLSVIAQGGKWLSPHWRKHYFAKWQYLNARLGLERVKRYVVNKETIVNNRLVLPLFKNVYMEYQVVGDYDAYLQKVEIKNLYHLNPSHWMAVFTFSKPVVDGRMVVKYL